MNYTILQGDNRTTLKTLADNSIDAIITDPPYGIDFLGKSWDANTGALETYQECLRVLKPGGHILAFSAARTYHHLAVTLEQAGFEIRDQIMWIYSSGFPKSQDVGKQIQKKLGVKETKPHKNNAPRIGGVSQGEEIKQQEQIVVTDPEAQAWAGWGTALKPAHEPIALARKPIKTSIRENVQKWGTGAYNIDATRVEFEDDKAKEQHIKERIRTSTREHNTVNQKTSVFGSFASKLDQGYDNEPKKDTADLENLKGRFPSNVIGEIPDYQKYFYCPKVSRKERHIGHEAPEAEPLNSPDQVRNHPLWEPSIGTNAHRLKEKIRASQGVETLKEAVESVGGTYKTNEAILPGIGMIKDHGIRTEVEKIRKARGITTANVGNNHPTVKPIELMKYLIKLVTPPGGTVLDPFNGSGSTGCAAVELGHPYTGCELDPAYVAIAEKRIAAWYEHTRDPAGEIFE